MTPFFPFWEQVREGSSAKNNVTSLDMRTRSDKYGAENRQKRFNFFVDARLPDLPENVQILVRGEATCHS